MSKKGGATTRIDENYRVTNKRQHPILDALKKVPRKKTKR